MIETFSHVFLFVFCPGTECRALCLPGGHLCCWALSPAPFSCLLNILLEYVKFRVIMPLRFWFLVFLTGELCFAFSCYLVWCSIVFNTVKLLFTFTPVGRISSAFYMIALYLLTRSFLSYLFKVLLNFKCIKHQKSSTISKMLWKSVVLVQFLLYT